MGSQSLETDRGPRPGMRLLPLLFPSSSTAAGIYVVYGDHGAAARPSLALSFGALDALLDPPRVVTTRIPRTAGGARAMDTDGRTRTWTAQTREARETDADERSRPNQVRSAAVRLVVRSFGGLTDNEGGDADGARAVTTAMVTVWNAALPPPSPLALSRYRRRWTIIRCVFAAMANKKNGTA